jgi:small conductance mechanosensitive channel
MDIFIDSLQAEAEALLRLAPRFALALLVVVLGTLAGKLARRATRAFLERVQAQSAPQRLVEGSAYWLCVLVSVGLALDILGWDRAFAGFLAGGGIAAVVLGFAFREIGENLLAGLMLTLDRPFEIGDVIRSGELEGVVRALSLRTTHIRAGDGRDIFIPNAQIVTQPLINYTLDGLRRLTFNVGIDYADDPARALALLREATEKVSGVIAEPPPRATVAELGANYVDLQVSFWIDSRDPDAVAAPVRTEAIKAARQALRGAGFTFSADVTTNVALVSAPGDAGPPPAS